MRRWSVDVMTKPPGVSRLAQPVGYNGDDYRWSNGFLLRVSPRWCVLAFRWPS